MIVPPMVEKLRGLKIPHEHRRGKQDVVVRCPCCSGRLLIDEEKPLHLCTGALHCSASRLTFGEIIRRLS